jgi:hypothetical protein
MIDQEVFIKALRTALREVLEEMIDNGKIILVRKDRGD